MRQTPQNRPAINSILHTADTSRDWLPDILDNKFAITHNSRVRLDLPILLDINDRRIGKPIRLSSSLRLAAGKLHTSKISQRHHRRPRLEVLDDPLRILAGQGGSRRRRLQRRRHRLPTRLVLDDGDALAGRGALHLDDDDVSAVDGHVEPVRAVREPLEPRVVGVCPVGVDVEVHAGLQDRVRVRVAVNAHPGGAGLCACHAGDGRRFGHSDGRGHGGVGCRGGWLLERGAGPVLAVGDFGVGGSVLCVGVCFSRARSGAVHGVGLPG